MAELASSDRLQPSLLDRLTDEDPKRKQESRNQKVITVRELRRAVLRDLAWLLNTANKMSPEQQARYPRATASALNYGAPDLTGTTGSSLSFDILRDRIMQSISRYEPRLIPGTVRVKIGPTDKGGPNDVGIEIAADLWADPTPESLFVRTDVDLETGACIVTDAGNG
ncbi:MAG: type VI secretion system baseplate subunit TssE [Planctomycetota bacterium]